MEPIPQHKFPVKAQLAVVLAYFFLLALLASLPADASDTEISPAALGFMRILQVLVTFFIFALPAIAFSTIVRAEKTAFLNMGQVPSRLGLVTALSCCIVAMPLVMALSQWNEGLQLPDSLDDVQRWMEEKENAVKKFNELFFSDRSTGGLIINLFVVALMPALVEELFFRGLMQRLFVDAKLNPHLAIGLTAFLFSAFHLQFFGFLPRLFLGAVLGYLYYYSGNLWVAILAHFVNNGFQVLLIHLLDMPVDAEVPGEADQLMGWPYALLSLVLVGGQIWLLRRDYFRLSQSE